MAERVDKQNRKRISDLIAKYLIDNEKLKLQSFVLKGNIILTKRLKTSVRFFSQGLQLMHLIKI